MPRLADFPPIVALQTLDDADVAPGEFHLQLRLEELVHHRDLVESVDRNARVDKNVLAVLAAAGRRRRVAVHGRDDGHVSKDLSREGRGRCL